MNRMELMKKAEKLLRVRKCGYSVFGVGASD